MANELEVFLARRAVGHLVETTPSAWTFVYNEQADPDVSGPLGVALPRSRERHHGPAVQAVFANLLPDGALRERLAQSLGLSAGNDFALLARVARECVGAIALRAPGAAWRDDRATRVLDAAELRNLVAVLPVHPLMAEVDDLSKTLPGEFDKLPVIVSERQVCLALGDELTTHIIKPARPGLRESVLNEAYCMALAHAFALPVAATDVLHGRVNVLAVTRVDRQLNDAVEALHMEDFCQALGYAPTRKYEREGGPRLSDIVALLRTVSIQPAVDIRELVRWTIFAFLIGFGAAHAKQLALLHTRRGPRLAPWFGLWSTHVYPEMNFRLGFSIGHEDRPDWLTAQRWHEFAVTIGVRPRYVADELRRASAALPALARDVATQFQRKHGYVDIVRGVRTLIEQRARQALVALEADRPGPPTAVKKRA